MNSIQLSSHHVFEGEVYTSKRTLLTYALFLIRHGVRSTAIWAGSAALYTAALILSFPLLKESSAELTYPDAVARAFNISDMGTINGYLNAEVFSYLPLILAIFPVLALAGAIAGAEERSRLDLLLGTPLSRRDLLLANVISTAVSMGAVVLILGSISWLSGMSDEIRLGAGDIFGATLAIWPFAMFFGSVAMVISTMTRRFATAAGLGIAVLVVMYAMDTIAKIAELDELRWIAAFRYYGTPLSDGVEWFGAVVLIAVSMALVAFAVSRFERRDIYT